VSTGTLTSPKVWVWQSVPGDLAQAVHDGGGVVVPLEKANAIVWAADEPEELSRRLHPRVRWVQLLSAGIEDWFKAGVVDDHRLWTAGKGVHAGPIAEYVLAMILGAARDLPAHVTEKGWKGRPPRRVAGSVVGVIGAGGIGRALIELMAPFQVRIVALTRKGSAVPGAHVSLAQDGLDRLLRESDYVVLAAPETPETLGLIGTDELSQMREHAWIINVGRGSLIDTDALVEALRAGHIGGAALDVTDPEPLPEGHPLWKMPNVVVTAHTASTWELGRAAFLDLIRVNVARFARGDELIGTVDPSAGY
jgi:phosphoglycerate dehydrogenase-like enzyme